MAKRARHRRRRRRSLPVALAALGVAALGAASVTVLDEDPRVAEAVIDPTTSAPPSSTSSSSSSTTATTAAPEARVTLAFAGDTNFEDVADPASLLLPFAPVLGGADLAVVNLETAIGTGGTPADKEFVFQAPPSALDAFRRAGVDVVSAANNHGMDFGVESLRETLAAGFPIIGIGADEDEAYAPYVADIRGHRVAVLAATQVLDGDLLAEWTAGPDQPGLASAKRVDRLLEAVRAARADADTVVVFLHWGVERETCPTASQRDLAAALVEAGADVVVGGHAHRLQGGGRLGDAVVHYGLGNFGFQANSPEGARTGVFLVTVSGSGVEGYEWVPGRVVAHQPRPLEGAEAATALAHWDGLRGCTGLSE